MGKYRLTKRAVQDLKEIWNYTFDKWSEKQADKYFRELLSRCSEIAEEPLNGKSYNNLIEGLRGIKVNRHLIFYRQLTKDEIEIERILHERMDLKSKFEND